MQNMRNTGVFAGTFDPFTIGHYDLVRRASEFFDKIYVGVAEDTGGKAAVLDLKKRKEIVEASLKDIKNAEVHSFKGFLKDFVKECGSSVIVRGLRTVNDFEYEKSLCEVYKSQDGNLEIFYLISSHNYNHISSTIVRELAIMGGDTKGYIQKNAEKLVKEYYYEAFKGRGHKI